MTKTKIRAAYCMSFLDSNESLVRRLQAEQNVNPVLWFGDPRTYEFARKVSSNTCLIVDHEGLVGGSALDSTIITQESTDKLNRFLDSEFFKIRETTLLNELNRSRNYSLIRLIDREARLRQILVTIIELYRQAKPDFFFANETPHDIIDLSGLFLAQWMGIQTLFFQPTSTIGPGLLPRTNLDEIFDISDIGLSKSAETELRVEFATEALKSFLTKRQPARMERELALEKSAPTRTSDQTIHRRRLALGTLRLLRHTWREEEWETQLSTLFHSAQQSKFLLGVRGLDGEAVPEQGSALFALHYQPERTSIPEGSRMSYQGDVVVQARAFLPPETQLIVKEHQSQISRRRQGFLGRSLLSYGFLQSLPNTLVVNPNWDLTQFWDRLGAIFTMTGSIGIEGALRGIPVFYFGNPWWQGLPGTCEYREDLDYQHERRNMLRSSTKEKLAFLENLVCNRTIGGFGTPSQKSFWDKHLNLGPDFWSNSNDATFQVVRKFLETRLGARTI